MWGATQVHAYQRRRCRWGPPRGRRRAAWGGTAPSLRFGAPLPPPPLAEAALPWLQPHGTGRSTSTPPQTKSRSRSSVTVAWPGS